MFRNVQYKIILLFFLIGIVIIAGLGIFFLNSLNLINGELELGNIESQEQFLNLIQNLDISDDVLYMNLDGVNTGSFYDLLKNNYSSNAKLKNQIVSSDSSLYLFTDGKIVNVLNNVSDYSIKRLENIIKSWGLDNA